MTLSSATLLSKSYLFDPRPRLPFRIVAQRYWITELPYANDHSAGLKTSVADTLTVVFMHAHSAHKEQWEPTIQRLFQNQLDSTCSTTRFHDMWSLDMLNHGDSAIANEDVLQYDCDISSCEHHARVVHAFLAGLGTGVNVDFSKRRLAIVGHSFGSLVGMFLNTYYPLVKISSLHLIEPFLTAGSVQNLFSALSEVSADRKDIWPSSEDAFRSLAQSTMHGWDERVVKIFFEHGLRPLPTAEYPDIKEGVTLKCTRKQEAAAYRDYVTPIIGYRRLPYLLKEIPTHMIFGSVPDYISDDMRHDILHIASRGITNFACVTRIPEAGHLMVQTHPDVLADTIWKYFTQAHGCSTIEKNAVAAKL